MCILIRGVLLRHYKCGDSFEEPLYLAKVLLLSTHILCFNGEVSKNICYHIQCNLLLVTATLRLLVAATLRLLVAATLRLLVAATLRLIDCGLFAALYVQRVCRPSCRLFLMGGVWN